MNLEETQKINRLAKELLAHHIVEDSNEATARAEKMILGKSEVQEAKQEAVAQEDNEIRYIHANLAQLHADIRRMTAEITGLKTSYETLKSSVSSIRERSNSVAPAAAVSAPAQAQPVAAQQTQPRMQEESPSRMGGFSDEQVAIDKIFYFGKK